MKIYLLIFVFCWTDSVFCAKTKQVLTFYRFENCRDQPPNPLFSIIEPELNNSVRGATVVKAKLRIFRDYPKNGQLVLRLRKCKNGDNLDSCVNWSPIKTPKFCELSTQKNLPWSNIFESIRPPWQCPIKKGMYTLEGKVELTDDNPNTFFLPLPIDKSYWIVRFEIAAGTKTLAALCFDIQLKTYHAK